MYNSDIKLYSCWGMSMEKFFRGRLFGLVLLCFVGIFAGVVLAGSSAQASPFCVGEDSFSISNGPGYCFAMAAFSRWYYLARQGEPPLRRALDKRTQQFIARQLQEFYSRNLITLQADYCNQHHANQAQSFNTFTAGVVSGDPRIVLLMNRGETGAILHAVLAYEWDAERRLIKVYDPNYNNEERYIDIDSGKYTSLDITYNAICFPEMLNDHEALVKKMESLYAAAIVRQRTASARGFRGPVARISGPRSKAEANRRVDTR